MPLPNQRLLRAGPRALAWLLLLFVAPLAAQSETRDQPAPAAPLEVVTTLHVLADLATTIGGEHVTVTALASPAQDPHYVEPTPVLMQRARRADLLIEVGLQLELWVDKVAAGSGNPRIQLGQSGRVVASQGVAALELPQVLSREWGDVHPYGNPHVWLDPLNVKTMAANISAGLCRLRPKHTEEFEANLADFERRIDEALFGAELVQRVGGKQLSRLARGGRLTEYLERRELTDSLGGWMARARPLVGRPVVTYHKTFVYLSNRFGFVVPVEIEENPGIAPSARHRDRVLALMRERGVRSILAASYYDGRAADYLCGKTGAHTIAVGIDVGGDPGASDYFGLMDGLLDALVASETTGN